MDNENDFLLKIAESILELTSICKGIDQLSILILPLKILAMLDQPAVRERSINALKALSSGVNKDIHRKYYLPLIRELYNNGKGPYSPRVAACCLITTVYPHLQ